MSRLKQLCALTLAAGAFACEGAPPADSRSQAVSDDGGGWPQWGQDGSHSGRVQVAGQRPARQLADLVYDPFVQQEQAEGGGDLFAHYQAPLTDGNDVYMMFKTGSYIPCTPAGSGEPAPCGPDAWNSQIWNERRLHWEGGKLVTKWSFQSDWKPEPGLFWEPVFHPALSDEHVYVPGAHGSLYKLSKGSGHQVAQYAPFGADANTYVAGPVTVDSAGSVYYNAIRLAATPAGAPTFYPWFFTDVVDSWLVKVGADGKVRTARYASLVPGAPAATDACYRQFAAADQPWPPSPGAVPPTGPCGSQRPGVNVAPAVADDGTIYTVSRAHLNGRYSYMVAVNPDLTPRWAASLRDRLHDGCGTSVMPPDGAPFGCRAGANTGVDPATNQAPAGIVLDQGTSTPVALPDGVLYGAYTAYNEFRGHLFKFGKGGDFVGSYDFGWDTTPAVYARRDAYSVVLKDNHYGFDAGGEGPFSIVQLSSGLLPEWRFTSTNTQSCQRNPDGTLSCVSDHPNGFEWCINAPAIDKDGTAYVNSEDGNLYVLNQGGGLKGQIFLNLALGAAYTPLSLGKDGRIYTQNAGHLFVVGE